MASSLQHYFQKDSELSPHSPWDSAGINEQHLARVRADGVKYECQPIYHSSVLDSTLVLDSIWLKSLINRWGNWGLEIWRDLFKVLKVEPRRALVSTLLSANLFMLTRFSLPQWYGRNSSILASDNTDLSINSSPLWQSCQRRLVSPDSVSQVVTLFSIQTVLSRENPLKTTSKALPILPILPVGGSTNKEWTKKADTCSILNQNSERKAP